MTGPLAGRRILVTRERPGELADRLEAHGATVVHVPLIATVDADGDALRTALDTLADHDWLVVTSSAGADRVGGAAAAVPSVRLAAVGTASAARLAELAGRPVDVVPTRQRADALAAALVDRAGRPPRRFLVAQADRAAPTLVDRLRAAGHDVTAVTAYRTELQAPPPGAVDHADAVVFASGSAVRAWCDALGATAPPIAVAIGPSTAAVADELGLKITSTAADHSLEGVVEELVRVVTREESSS
jgi:uroporphyrinogen-III synthase